jgi:hypothetical protein
MAAISLLQNAPVDGRELAATHRQLSVHSGDEVEVTTYPDDTEPFVAFEDNALTHAVPIRASTL